MKTIEGIQFLTVLEVAQRLGVTPSSVRTWIKQGKLTGKRIGRNYLIPEHSYKALLNFAIAPAEVRRAVSEA